MQDVLLLRRASQITASAQGAGNGGNIQINGDFLIAVPNEDSNISANSEDFRGGNVRINASAIYGLQQRSNLTSLSDITATGATSALSGTIDVTTPELDPTSGLVELPTALVDSSSLIAQGCPAYQGNSFVVTGRGGLPPTPEQQLDDDAAWRDRRWQVASQPTDKSSMSSKIQAPIIEATGWQRTPAGEIRLVANSPSSTLQNVAVLCNGRSDTTK